MSQQNCNLSNNPLKIKGERLRFQVIFLSYLVKICGRTVF